MVFVAWGSADSVNAVAVEASEPVPVRVIWTGASASDAFTSLAKIVPDVLSRVTDVNTSVPVAVVFRISSPRFVLNILIA